MSRIKVPTPPIHTEGTHAIVENGLYVCHIWAFDAVGVGEIETQYKQAEAIMKELQVSRSTAYRMIHSVPKRYWYTDMSNPERPTVRSVLPKETVQALEVRPRGNPNLRSGIYQQEIARRRRK